MRRRHLMVLLGVAAIASPLGARAQQPMPVVGWLSTGSPETDNATCLTGFRQGLNESGYVEGQTVAIEYRWAQGEYDRLPALAADLVRRQVSVIDSGGAPPAFAAKAATATIPIIFNQGVDPVEAGLVGSLNRPGGNVTGVVNLIVELMAKRLDLLHELLPTAAVVALLVNPVNPAAERAIAEAQGAAHSLGLQLQVLKASAMSETDTGFETLVALRNRPSSYTATHFSRTGKIKSSHWRPPRSTCDLRMARVCPGRWFNELRNQFYRQLAASWRSHWQILRGASPAELPVQQAVELQLVINLQTAKALGLTIPPVLLTRADEVIE